MQHVSKRAPRWMAALLSVTVMTGCGGGGESPAANEENGDVDYSFHCNESRGALHRYQMMVDGQSRIEEGSLETWMLAKLAEERKAPAEVMRHIEDWSHARKVRRDALRAMPPIFSEGRVVEPDTTAIDREMMQSILPHHRALEQWVKEECGEV